MKQNRVHPSEPQDSSPCKPQICPLSQLKAGSLVCLKELATSPDVTRRLRELGFLPEQRIRLLSTESALICQVCNARLAISEKLGDAILVQPLEEAAPAGI